MGHPGVLERYLKIARAAVEEAGSGAVLVVLDADDDLPCVLAPELLARARACLGDLRVEVVLARRCYEAWLIAGLELPGDSVVDPDELSNPAAHLKQRLGRYKKTADQPALSQRLDILKARRRSPSFDKFLRSLTSIDPEGLQLPA